MTSTPGSYDKDDEDREDVDKEEEWAEVRFAASDLSKVKVCQNDSHERERRLDERCVADALDKEERNNEEFGLETEWPDAELKSCPIFPKVAQKFSMHLG